MLKVADAISRVVRCLSKGAGNLTETRNGKIECDTSRSRGLKAWKPAIAKALRNVMFGL